MKVALLIVRKSLRIACIYMTLSVNFDFQEPSNNGLSASTEHLSHRQK